MSSRRLGSSSSSDASFVFDGTNSNISRQLHVRYQDGEVGDKIQLTSVPTAVKNRLEPLHISFDSLPGLVQLAVLWDSGFAISPGNDPVQIWTIDNFTMDDIAVPKAEVSGAGCDFKDCPQPNDVTAFYTLICSGTQMLSVSRCVVDNFRDDAAAGFLGAMWSRGGKPNMAPLIRLREHTWKDPESNDSFSLYAVHTVPDSLDATWGQCPPGDGYASLTVPCYRRDNITEEMAAMMTTPQGTEWVTTWLEEEFAVRSGISTLTLVLISLGAFIVVLLVIGLGWLCWRRSRRTEKPALDAADFEVDSSVYLGGTPELGKWSTNSTLLTHQSSLSESPGSNCTLQILLDSQFLQGRRLPCESLIFKKTLSKGASGEIWLCSFGGYDVAVKRLLQGNQKAENVQAFAEEIELTASLVHPNIVEFIGVAWNSLNNLAMVMEFFPRGNLQMYLQQNHDLLSWARDKIQMAVAIAQALEYLHGRLTPIIHRDLKSNNILLTDKLEPKLIDFGVSRGKSDATMTAGVGTPYWTAPEILEGKRYTEQADIYSFGVVLSELDTGKIPYYDAVTENGSKAKPFQILQEVMTGSLRPSFTPDCPPRIQRVGLACLSFDPSYRPTARQLVQELEGNTTEVVYSF
ncbi:hypothetical protein V7S43_014201 [Phytophthora oleae]|uniref:Protein kinase domain-containing protein n=1 Tax=Phytophthora oleae TaxID=2107226 RepID=A0ABD3F6V7_9STRA